MENFTLEDSIKQLYIVAKLEKKQQQEQKTIFGFFPIRFWSKTTWNACRVDSFDSADRAYKCLNIDYIDRKNRVNKKNNKQHRTQLDWLKIYYTYSEMFFSVCNSTEQLSGYIVAVPSLAFVLPL